MKRSDDTGKISGQPPLAELTARYLQQQAAAHADGLAPQPAGDVVPFEAAPVQPVDPRLAWEEAVGVLPHFSPGIQTRSWQAPPQWPQLVAAHEPVVALVFCLGNYPQLVRNFQPLLHAAELTKFRPLP